MIVIADDITGAAEIAGIAHSHGHCVRLACGDWVDADGTLVIATDTRSMTKADAVAETLRIASRSPLNAQRSTFNVQCSTFNVQCFKKTDSALRGHVTAELAALMQATGLRRAVYLPANPSRGRIIRDGIYLIDGTPIHQTDFSFDPEFPATSSSLSERFPDAASLGIIMPDAETLDDIRQVIARYDDGATLFAGATDLFSLLMDAWGTAPVRSRRTVSPLPSDCECAPVGQTGTTLVFCGSTQSRPLNIGIPVAPMPRAVYDGEQGADYWFAHLPSSIIHHSSSIILTIPFSHLTGRAVAVRLRTVMAAMASRLVRQHCPARLIIEGGATAWAVLQALGWTDFEVEGQAAPGVVQMRCVATGTLVTLKPGSYPWPTEESLWSTNINAV